MAVVVIGLVCVIMYIFYITSSGGLFPSEELDIKKTNNPTKYRTAELNSSPKMKHKWQLAEKLTLVVRDMQIKNTLKFHLY